MRKDQEAIQVAYCADSDVEIGLHASVTSLLNNNDRIDLHILTDQSRPISKDLFLEAFLSGRTEIKFYEVNSKSFGRLAPLVGSRFAYSKLLIPDVVDTDKVIYLDTDTIVDTDVSELWHMPIADSPLCALNAYPVYKSIESPFLADCGLKENDKYFNTGVLIFNNNMWKQNRLVERTLDFASTHPRNLKTADQTVLNALLSRRISGIDSRFNRHFWPTSDPQQYARGQYILHFAGGLKPWDAFGAAIHSGYGIWSSYSNTKYADRMRKRSSVGELLRCARRYRYYARALYAKWTR